MSVQAVLDRIVDNKYAVLLVTGDEQEYIIPLEKLPLGAVEGSWLEVDLAEGALTQLRLLPAETEQIHKRIADKMSLLRARGSSLRRKEDK